MMKAQKNPENSADIWLNTAYEVLIESGVEAVKIMVLAKRTGLTRTGFYWHFKDLGALLEALVQQWEAVNTGNLISRAEAPAKSITEAMLNVFDCWYDSALFDAPLDLAIRNWARNDARLHARLERADESRIAALVEMFCRHGYNRKQAQVRSMTVIYTQIGFISMCLPDSKTQRLSRVPQYVDVFTGVKPSPSEVAKFRARHK